MLALIAAREAAVIASGHTSPLTGPIGTGTVDGFAAGMLLSGVVCLLILAQRRAARRPARAAARAPAQQADEAVADLSTHPYADVQPFRPATPSPATPSPATPDLDGLPFADAANEVVLQPGIRLEEWLEGQLRRPSLPGSSRTPVPAPVPAAVVAAEATTAVVPATPATPAAPETSAPAGATWEADQVDKPDQHRRAPAYQSKHRLAGRGDSKPPPDNHRRVARHAAVSSARPGTMSRMFSLRQLRPVGAGE